MIIIIIRMGSIHVPFKIEAKLEELRIEWDYISKYEVIEWLLQDGGYLDKT